MSGEVYHYLECQEELLSGWLSSLPLLFTHRSQWPWPLCWVCSLSLLPSPPTETACGLAVRIHSGH